MEKTYFEQRKIDTTEKLRLLRKKLPFICNEYFIGIQTRTSELTQLGYAVDLQIFFDYLHNECYEFKDIDIIDFSYEDLDNVTVTHIEMFLEYLSHYKHNGKWLSNSIKTKARKLSSIKSFFKYNYNKNNIKKDIAAKILSPKITDKPIIRLENDEVQDLLDEVETGYDLQGRAKAYHDKTAKRDTAIVSLFLGTGIRISELVGINISDIDFSNNSFRITRKGGNQTILYFTDEVAIALLDYLDERDQNHLLDNEAMFLSLQNKRINIRSVQNLIKKYASIVTPLKNITPHKLRSTFGTQLYQKTGDIYVVAECLGHKDINTTKRHYAAISEQIKKNASLKVTLRDNK